MKSKRGCSPRNQIGPIVRVRGFVIVIVLAIATVGLGCSAPQAPRVEQMYAAPPVNQSAALEHGAFASKSLLVGQITGEEPTGEDFNNLRDALWFAMETSLDRSHIFRAVVTNGSANYKLDGVIVSHQEQTGSPAATSAVLIVRYRLTDVSNSHTIWQETITSHYDQPVSGGQAAATNLLSFAVNAPAIVYNPLFPQLTHPGNISPDIPGANEGVVRDNLTRLIDKLAALSVSQGTGPR